MHLRAPEPGEPLAPEEAARRRRSQRALHALLLCLLMWPLVRGWERARSAKPAATGAGIRLEVDLARDPAWRLALLPGVGPRRAHEIVRARERHGPPDTLEGLRRIPTIGSGTLARLRDARSVRVLLAGRPVGCRHEPAPAPARSRTRPRSRAP